MTPPTTPGPADPFPPVLGNSHLGLSVADLDAAGDFWTRVMGFEVTTRLPSLCFVVHRGANRHRPDRPRGTVTGPFDHRRTGLDHLAIAVPGSAALQAWASRLDAMGVPHSGITDTDAGQHLNLRGPDGFPVELFVLSPDAAAAFDLTAPDEGVARTHP